MSNEVIIYKDGELELLAEVTPDKGTVWLRVEEMAELFDRDRSCSNTKTHKKYI